MVALDTVLGIGSAFALLCSQVSAAVVYPRQQECREPLERSEWRSLTTEEQSAYITAVRCLQSKPAINPEISAAVSRFDEFQALHITYAERVHQVGQFLPWHRYFVSLYETALRDECEYEGTQPYWDWTEDADGDRIHASPVFDPETGFGGDGDTAIRPLPGDFALSSPTGDPGYWRGCVMDGPFKDYRIRLGPGKMNVEHCLVRGINETYTNAMRSPAIDRVMSMSNFEDFRLDLEGTVGRPEVRVHKAGHFVVGGDMCNFYSAPADPLFYLHHANIDRIWWNWQQADRKRLTEVTGRSTIRPPHQNITLDSPLEMGTLAPTVPIRLVMDTMHTMPRCYVYV